MILDIHHWIESWFQCLDVEKLVVCDKRATNDKSQTGSNHCKNGVNQILLIKIIIISVNCSDSWNSLLWSRKHYCWSAEYQWCLVPCDHQYDNVQYVCNHQCHHNGGPHFPEGTFQWHVQDWCLLPNKADCRVSTLCINSCYLLGNSVFHGIVHIIIIYPNFSLFHILFNFRYHSMRILRDL